MIKILKNMGRREVVMSIICLVLVASQVYFDLTLPEYMTELTTLITTQGEMSQIWITGAKMLAYALASGILSIVCGYLVARVGSGLSFRIRQKLFGHTMDFGKQDIQKFSTPSLINRTTNDITQIQMFVTMGLQILIKSPIMAVWAIIKILGKSWQLSLVTAGFIAVILITILIITFLVIPRFKKVQKLTDAINRVARENLNGINVVHAFNAEDFQNEKFEKANTELNKVQMFNQHAFSFFAPVMNVCMNGLTLSIYWVGAAILSTIPAINMLERITFFGDIVVFITYAMQVVMSFMMMIMVFMMFPPAQVSAKRVNEVLDTKASIKEGTVKEAEEVGTVEFKNVFFRYPDASEDELKDISFKVSKGETVAFIGATGSGKTTLVNLVARFYDVSQGQVLIDGIDVKDYTFEALYNRLGFVTQKAVLFKGSIKDNVNFGEGKEEVSDEYINYALKLAQATEFVEKLDGGINYQIAQRGKNISGGQKQRLSIARALARNPEILIFDDSFSAVDYKTDAKLRAGLNENLSDTTRLIVAQRISTIRNADKIIVLNNGQIAGMGKHSELLKNCEIYKEIASSQLSSEELQEEAK